MSKKILSVFVLCAMALSVASCLEDDKEELVYYDDTAVTGFTLGTLNKYVTLKSSADSDSIVKSTLDASSYRFSVNNIVGAGDTCRIYNADSLPVGVDITKVVCTVSTKNSGLAVWCNKTSDGKDSLSYHSSTDSLDFTTPRELRVYNTNMSAFRRYRVQLNVHKEHADTFVWRNMATSATLASLQAMKMVCTDNYIYILGSDGTNTKVYVSDRTHFNGFSESNTLMGIDAYKNVAVFNDEVYVLDGTTLKCPGKPDVASNVPVTRLIGAGNNRMYGYTANGNVMYSTDGKTWVNCNTDGDKALLPTDDINLVAQPTKTNSDTYQLMLIGNVADSCRASVWGKIEEGLNATYDQPWAMYDIDEKNFSMPALDNLQTFAYNGKIYAIGGNGINGNTDKAFGRFYSSKDAGLTWQTDTTLALPGNFASDSASFTFASDKDNYIWIACGGSGQVWRGRLNKLGWAIKE